LPRAASLTLPRYTTQADTERRERRAEGGVRNNETIHYTDTYHRERIAEGCVSNSIYIYIYIYILYIVWVWSVTFGHGVRGGDRGGHRHRDRVLAFAKKNTHANHK
jgi:hypothetical protein